MFISSPSKSALKGVQTHSLKRNVFPVDTLTLKPIMLIRCRLGCLLKITISPSRRCLSTMSPILSWIFPFAGLIAIFSPNLVTMKLAPPRFWLPLRTHSFRKFMEYWLTVSLMVSILAMCSGTMTTSGRRLGSGEMTVLAV